MEAQPKNLLLVFAVAVVRYLLLLSVLRRHPERSEGSL